MNPEHLFCPNIDCPARGQTRQGNLVIHSQQEKRCYCTICLKTFAMTKGTLFYRLRTNPQTVMFVIVLLAYGCPIAAIVTAFGLDERTSTLATIWSGRGKKQQFGFCTPTAG